MKTVFVSSAAALITNVTQIKPAAVLSIEDPYPEDGGHIRAPRLYTDHRLKTPQYTLAFFDDEDYEGPTAGQVGQAMNFLRTHHRTGPVIIQDAHAGPIALALAMAFMVEANPNDDNAIAHIREACPKVAPNRLIIRHADDMRGLGGHLIRYAEEDPVFRAARAASTPAHTPVK